ncbi:MAG: putative metal-binding motif-containing protein [Phycisphaerales bacterium]|nr:putative metal-binding motif-containing protein [Phycisphaerales bacterium]
MRSTLALWLLALSGCVVDADDDGSPLGEDCDDLDASRWPEADEICGDGVDSNCDGEDSVGCSVEASARAVFEYSAHDAYWGWPAVIGSDVTGDGRDDVAIGMLVGATWPGVVEVWSGDNFDPGSTPDLFTSDCAVFDHTDADTHTGVAFDLMPDSDGDGVGELVVARYSASDTVNREVLFVMGPCDGGIYPEDADATVAGDSGPGSSVAGLSDLDGDGLGDAAFGWRYDSVGARYGGAAWLLSGTTLAEGGDLDPDDLGLLIVGDEGDELGWDLRSAGDLNGDGLTDVAIAADEADEDVVFFGGDIEVATVASSDADLVFTGSALDSLLPYAPESAGDLDGDGLDDLVVDRGSAGDGLFWGASLEGESSISRGSSDVLIDTMWARSVGDLDGDGLPDIAACTACLDEEAGIILVSGVDVPATGTVDDALTYGSFDTGIWTAYAGGGDLDADGYDDLVIGQPGYSATDGYSDEHAGRAFILLGW